MVAHETRWSNAYECLVVGRRAPAHRKRRVWSSVGAVVLAIGGEIPVQQVSRDLTAPAGSGGARQGLRDDLVEGLLSGGLDDRLAGHRPHPLERIGDGRAGEDGSVSRGDGGRGDRLDGVDVAVIGRRVEPLVPRRGELDLVARLTSRSGIPSGLLPTARLERALALRGRWSVAADFAVLQDRGDHV